MKFLTFLVFLLSVDAGQASPTSFYACKSVAEYSAMSLVDQGMDILSARSHPFPDQSKYILAPSQVRVRIVVDEDQAGLHIFGATVSYTLKRIGTEVSYSCEVTDLEAL